MSQIRPIRESRYKKHHGAVVEHGDVEEYARLHGFPVVAFQEDLLRHGVLDELAAANTQKALLKMRKVLLKKADVAAGFVEVIEEANAKVLRILRNEDHKADGEHGPIGYSMNEVEALVKAAALAADKLLVILGDPTTISAVGVDARIHVEESIGVLERLANRAGVEVPIIDV